MKTKIIITAAALLLSIPAIAQFKAITEAYEVALHDLRLPRNDGGTIAFKACGECDYETRRVAANARWQINGEDMTLEEFRDGVDDIDRHESVAVTVTHHIESDRITNVAVIVWDTE